MSKIKLFGSQRCGPCKMVKPLLEKIGDVEYIDVDENPEAAQEAGVRSIPFYINTDNGKSGYGVKNIAALRDTLEIPA